MPNYQWLNKSVWLTASCFKDYLTKTKKKQEKSPRGLLSKNYTTILRLRNPPITQGGISQNKLFLSYGRMPLLHVIIIEGLRDNVIICGNPLFKIIVIVLVPARLALHRFRHHSWSTWLFLLSFLNIFPSGSRATLTWLKVINTIHISW